MGKPPLFPLPKIRNGTSVIYKSHHTTIKNAVWGYNDMYELHGLEGAFHESEFTIVTTLKENEPHKSQDNV